jgi:hypothetical protein
MNTRLKTYEVRLTFSDEVSSAGTAGRLSWVSDQAHVPADLIVRRADRLGIFVVRGETARFVPLAEARPGQPAPVDLPGETPVLVDGRFVVQEGDTVAAR